MDCWRQLSTKRCTTPVPLPNTIKEYEVLQSGQFRLLETLGGTVSTRAVWQKRVEVLGLKRQPRTFRDDGLQLQSHMLLPVWDAWLLAGRQN